jgi:hypothetical protein
LGRRSSARSSIWSLSCRSVRVRSSASRSLAADDRWSESLRRVPTGRLWQIRPRPAYRSPRRPFAMASLLDVLPKGQLFDDELVVLDDSGSPQFNDLLFEHGRPHYVAFNLLMPMALICGRCRSSGARRCWRGSAQGPGLDCVTTLCEPSSVPGAMSVDGGRQHA